MAETEISIMNRQCLDRRIDDAGVIRGEVGAWEEERNGKGCKIHWTFTVAAARVKLKTIYPSVDRGRAEESGGEPPVERSRRSRGRPKKDCLSVEG
jgi:hypothetical protein